MGTELYRFSCSERFLNKSTIVNILPVFFASLLAGAFCGALLSAAGYTGAGIIAGVALVAVLTGCTALFDIKQKKVYAETFLSICENGITGRYGLGYTKTAEFSYEYAGLKTAKGKKSNLKITPRKGKRFVFITDDAVRAAELIREKLQ